MPALYGTTLIFKAVLKCRFCCGVVASLLACPSEGPWLDFAQVGVLLERPAPGSTQPRKQKDGNCGLSMKKIKAVKDRC